MRMTNLSRSMTLVLMLFGLVMATLTANAQTDGQFCVRAYDDRNANGVRDASEPTLQSGISAELTESNGIVIASALLADSPTAAQGIICFDGLAPGQYSIIVTSADFSPTTPNTMSVAIQAGDLPSVLEFGARSLNIAATVDVVNEVAPSPEQALERLLIAVLGAIIATLVMLVLGIIIFVLFFRGRKESQAQMVSTDEMFRPPSDTGQY